MDPTNHYDYSRLSTSIVDDKLFKPSRNYFLRYKIGSHYQPHRRLWGLNYTHDVFSTVLDMLLPFNKYCLLSVSMLGLMQATRKQTVL